MPGSAYWFTVREQSFRIAAFVLVCVSALTAHAAAPTTAPADLARAEEFTGKVRPLLQKYCYECHGDGNTAGELDMGSFKSAAAVTAARPTWLKMIRHARSQVMPPPDAELQPTQAQRDELVALLQRQLFDPSRPDPGRTPLRRLNRTEYRNTVRDLLGVGFDPTLDFPQDDTGYGFDNIADVLTLPPMLMEKYLHAAEKILDEAVPTDDVERVERHVAATEATTTFRNRAAQTHDEWVSLGSNQEDGLSFFTDSAVHGEYVIRVFAYAKYPDMPPPGFTEHPPLKLSIMVGDAVAKDVEVHADRGDPKWYEARVGIAPGRQQVRVALRRLRGPKEDRNVSDGRAGLVQPGEAYVKEIVLIGPVSGAVRRVGRDRMETTATVGRNDFGVALHKTDDRATVTIDVPANGKYVLRALASADYAGDEPAKMELLLDDKPLRTFDVASPSALMSVGAAKDLSQRARRAIPRVYDVTTTLKAGRHTLAARFVNNLKQDDAPDPNYRDRNIHLAYFEYVELSAPVLSPPMTEPMRKLFARHGAMKNAGEKQAREVLADFARRAWRRPPSDADVDRLMKLYALARRNGEQFAGGVKHAMKAVLVSPKFLFRGDDLATADSDKPQPIGEFELASRLSYFLWSTTPDEELLSLAERGELRKNLDAQIKRMLASNKSRELVDNFAGQWLQFRNLDAAHPDAKTFEKQYDDRLRDAMKRETQLFFESILKTDASLLDVLVADYTFLNERLAKHYGIDGVKGEEFRRVSLKDTPRRGVLTQGSVLTLTSNPTRTSPVKRGKYVLQNLLGTEPPPPPPNVPPLVTDGQELTGTLRQRLEKHREDVMCASCHAPMDPIGFGLENFDAIGRWRDSDGKLPIDPSSEFVSGDKFSGAKELTALLARTRKNDFYRSVAENALTFALGRGVEPFDQPAVDKIVDDLKAADGKFSSLVMGVVNSTPFQMRRGNGQDSGPVAEVSHE